MQHMMGLIMKRGEIFYADLNPSIGSEINKVRPVLIISNDANNRASATVTIIPITSNINKVFPFEVFLPAKKSGLSKDSKLQCQQIRTIEKKRIKKGNPVGQIKNHELFHEIIAAVKLHLALD